MVGFSLLDQSFFKIQVQATGRVVYCVVIFGRTLEGGGGEGGGMTTSKLQGKPSEILGEDGWVAYNPEKYLIRGRGGKQ